MIKDKIAVLLLAFGGPTSIDEVEPFLMNVTSNRISREKIQEVIERYKKIGGKSPLLDITENQAKALEKMLGKEGEKFEVFVGMRYWYPFIPETLKTILSKGIKNIIALPLTPYYSSISTGGYQIDVEKELVNKNIKWIFIKSWYNNPLFIKSWIELISEETKKSENPIDTEIIFSAHSIPQKLIDDGEPYLSQIKETIEKIVAKIGYKKYHLGFQSKGGGMMPWLGPDTLEVMKQIKDSGKKNILLVPVGFISDNIEILYDIDVFYKNEAGKLGLNFKRTPCLNNNTSFIEALAQIIMDTRGQ